MLYAIVDSSNNIIRGLFLIAPSRSELLYSSAKTTQTLITFSKHPYGPKLRGYHPQCQARHKLINDYKVIKLKFEWISPRSALPDVLEACAEKE